MEKHLEQQPQHLDAIELMAPLSARVVEVLPATQGISSFEYDEDEEVEQPLHIVVKTPEPAVGLDVLSVLLNPLILLLGIPFTWVAYHSVYMFVASCKNTTYMTMAPRSIRVKHMPMKKFSQDTTLSTKGCSDAIVTQTEVGSTNGNPDYAYGVNMIMEQPHGVQPIQHIILKDLHNYEEAHFIQFKLSQHLRQVNGHVVPIASAVNVETL